MIVMVTVECEVPDEMVMVKTVTEIRRETQQAVEAAVARFGGFDEAGMAWPYYGLYPLRVAERGVKVVDPTGR